MASCAWRGGLEEGPGKQLAGPGTGLESRRRITELKEAIGNVEGEGGSGGQVGDTGDCDKRDDDSGGCNGTRF